MNTENTQPSCGSSKLFSVSQNNRENNNPRRMTGRFGVSEASGGRNSRSTSSDDFEKLNYERAQRASRKEAGCAGKSEVDAGGSGVFF